MSIWTTHTVAGHRCEVFEPMQPSQHNDVVIYLHGVHLTRIGEHAAFMKQFERHGLRVVCPMVGRSWWTDRLCPDFDTQVSAEAYVMQSILPFIRQQLECQPPRIALLGTSMGGQGALRFSYKYPDVFPVCAAIAPAIDFQLKWKEGDEILMQMYQDAEDARQDTAILHIHPLNWPRHQFFCCDPDDDRWINSADRLQMKLSSLGVPHECDLETRAGGHGFQYYNAMAERAVAFIARGLEKERLRIV